METVKNIFLVVDIVCWSLIGGVGIYRLALLFKKPKGQKTKDCKITDLPLLKNFTGETFQIVDDTRPTCISLSELKKQ